MVFHKVALLNHNAKNTKNKDYKYIYKFRKVTDEFMGIGSQPSLITSCRLANLFSDHEPSSCELDALYAFYQIIMYRKGYSIIVIKL